MCYGVGGRGIEKKELLLAKRVHPLLFSPLALRPRESPPSLLQPSTQASGQKALLVLADLHTFLLFVRVSPMGSCPHQVKPPYFLVRNKKGSAGIVSLRAPNFF